LRTKADDYENYELGLEWKYPSAENGNSGILVHTTDADRIWPKSIQVQLHRPVAGSIFPNEGAASDNTQMVRDLSRPVNQWNTCVVRCIDGRVSAVVNGQPVGKVTGCVPRKGSIALQSEGAEIHFRKMWLKRIKPEPQPDQTGPQPAEQPDESPKGQVFSAPSVCECFAQFSQKVERINARCVAVAECDSVSVVSHRLERRGPDRLRFRLREDGKQRRRLCAFGPASGARALLAQ
jgi:hypothetical protein